MKKSVTILLVMYALINWGKLSGQSGLVSTTDFNCTWPGAGVDNLYDNDLTTYFQSGPCAFYLKINLSKTVEALKVDIVTDYPGVTVNPGAVENYYETTKTTDEFYIVDPSGFSSLSILPPNSNSQVKIYEITLSEVTLNMVSLPYLYDAAGNMTDRKIVLTGYSNQKSSQEALSGSRDKISGKDIVIYPNPTQGAIQLEIKGLDQKDQASYKIFTTTGNLLQSGQHLSEETQINLSVYPGGMYLLQITVNSEKQQWTIVKE